MSNARIELLDSMTVWESQAVDKGGQTIVLRDKVPFTYMVQYAIAVFMGHSVDVFEAWMRQQDAPPEVVEEEIRRYRKGIPAPYQKYHRPLKP